ncbi:MAG: glycosyltransferase [Gammaproteobacteria bacterium]
MKILFINSHSPDYVEDQLFSALTEIYGKDSVTPFPLNYRYYIKRKPYPLDMGRCRTAFGYLVDRLTIQKKLKAFDYDYIILGSTKRDVFEKFSDIREAIPAGLPLIYIDGGDFPEVGGDASRLKFRSLYDDVVRQHKFSHIFKREYIIGQQYPDNVHPLPMAFKPQSVNIMGEKKYDVTCWCVESDPIRTRALTLLEDVYDCRENGTTLNQTFKNYKRKGLAYLKDLGRSRISCNFRGVGWDTLRYWEIPAVGALMVSQKPGIDIPDNFVHGEHVVFCKDDLSDLTGLIDYHLSHRDEAAEMTAEANRHLLKHHTHIKRAEFLIEVSGFKE